jgi:hypothetical protein
MARAWAQWLRAGRRDRGVRPYRAKTVLGSCAKSYEGAGRHAQNPPAAARQRRGRATFGAMFGTRALLPALALLAALPALGQASFDQKTVDVGNMGLNLTNFGTIGRPNVRNDPGGPPSMEYPINSGIEHLFEAGFWIGARVGGQTLVSTSTQDAPSGFNTGAPGFEFSAEVGNTIGQRSTLTNSEFFAFDGVSHQDMVLEFTDANVVIPGTSIAISGHDQPLFADVRLETYAWNFSFADFFVLFNYEITNNGTNTWDSVYLGMWSDMVVRNVNVATDFGSAFFSQGGYGYVDSLHANYAFDNDGDPGFTESYGAIQFLGIEWRDLFLHPDNAAAVIGEGYPEPKVHSNFWIFQSTGAPPYNAPANDLQAYDKMKRGLNYVDPDLVEFIANPSTTGGMTNLVSAGPLESVEPGESFRVVFALVCAPQLSAPGTVGLAKDTEAAREKLIEHLGWAQRTYRGEDLNGNGVLDPGEDLDDDDELDRYILPEPPATPRVHIVPDDRGIDVYWDASAEASIDPISQRQDFEGYKLYRTQVGEDLGLNLLAEADLIGQWDKGGNAVGYNNGFQAIRLPAPVYFDGDTTAYRYRFRFDNLLNGWQYLVIVTAFDEGDEALRIEPLESSFVENAFRVFPGVGAIDYAADPAEPGVYPNPYRLNAAWDGSTARTRKIIFYNLPDRAEIRVYTLGGDLVASLDHDAATYRGEDIDWFANFAGEPDKRILAGGEHAWDVLSQSNQTITQGLYLFTVKDLETGKARSGRFAVLR